ncbi:MAG: hypothetical protein Kow00108_01940 [Calditrichia bacterium]
MHILRRHQFGSNINRYLIFLLFIFSFSFHSTVYSQLSGTYTIGSGGDYTTINDAITALESSGVSGPVTFNILNGTYNEQFTINPISGASQTNTITFQSQSTNAADVEIWFEPSGSSDNYVVKINGADHINIKYLTFTNDFITTSYNRIVVLESETEDLEFQGNVFNGKEGAGSNLNMIFFIPIIT